MVSDDEKQFFSGGFKAFLKCCGIEHVCVSPYWARSNGKSVRKGKENFRAAVSAAKSWKIKLPKFFMLYGASLHQIIGKSPSMLLFNRELWTKLPHIELDSNTLRTSVKLRFVSSAFERLSRIALSLNRRSNIFGQDEAKRIRFKFRCVLARNHWDQSERHFSQLIRDAKFLKHAPSKHIVMLSKPQNPKGYGASLLWLSPQGQDWQRFSQRGTVTISLTIE